MLAPFDVTNVTIGTPRLILRPWTSSDLDDLYEYASVEGVGECAGWSHHKSLDESKVILNIFIEGGKTFAIVRKEDGKVMGSFGLEELSPDPVAGDLYGRELGYVLGKPYWGKGYATEAVQAVIDYCFRNLGYDYLTVAHFLWNDRSRRVIEKAGFQYIKNIQYETHAGTVEESRLYLLENPNKVR